MYQIQIKENAPLCELGAEQIHYAVGACLAAHMYVLKDRLVERSFPLLWGKEFLFQSAQKYQFLAVGA